MRLKSRVDTDFQPRHKEKSSVFYRGLCLHSGALYHLVVQCLLYLEILILFQQIHQILFGLKSDGFFSQFSIFENQKSRNAGDAITLSQFNIGVYIDFSNFYFSCGLGCDFINDRSCHATRTAPVRPEIQKYGNL